MIIRKLHSWDVKPTEAVSIQKQLRDSLSQKSGKDLSQARLIGGVDVSCTRFDPTLTAGVIVWDRETGQVVDHASAQMSGTFPYVPGLLSFREIPALALALEKLQTVPEVFMVDGQGRAHPRRLGIASHLGLVLDHPTIGVGKSRLCGSGEEPEDRVGAMTSLVHQDEEIAKIVRLRLHAKPVFVSVGHKIDLMSAVALVQSCARGYRLPEPTRLAHVYVNAVRTKSALPFMVGTEQPALL